MGRKKKTEVAKVEEIKEVKEEVKSVVEEQPVETVDKPVEKIEERIITKRKIENLQDFLF